MKTKRKGFTLVELLVVIAILGILASVSVVGYLGFTKKAAKESARSEFVQLKTNFVGKVTDGEMIDSYRYELNGDSVEIYYIPDTRYYKVVGTSSYATSTKIKTSNLKSHVQALLETTQEVTTLFANERIEKITYISTNGYTLVWDLLTDTIDFA